MSVRSALMLYDKIKAAVPSVVSSSGGTAETFRITQLAEGVERTPQIDAQINAIIAAHDWNTKDNEEKIRNKLLQAITDSETAEAAWDGWTNAQKFAAMKKVINTLGKVCRLLVRKLDTD